MIQRQQLMCSVNPEPIPYQRLPSVLLIEDTEDLQIIIQLGLELMAGFKVTTIKSDEDWLTLIHLQAPDLILLDLSSNGSDILTTLQDGETTYHIPVVCIMSRDRFQDLTQVKQQGAVATISKPFDLTVLAEIILNILGR